MAGRVIEDFELATNPTKLWHALGKAKESKNVVKSCRGYFLRFLAVSSCMRLTWLCLQSPAGGVRKEDSERNEAHLRPYCRRKRGRSGVIVLLLVLLALAVTASEELDNHVNMPPLPGGSMRQQLSEQDLRSIHGDSSVDDTIKCLEKYVRRRREDAKRRREEAKEMDEEADELQERIKVLRQTQQGCAKQDEPKEGESPGEAQGPYTTQKLKLKFNGSLSNTIYANDSLLKYSNGEPVEIAIYRDNQVITSGDLSSLEVEIVALKHGHTCKGDWTEEDFNYQIIRSGQDQSRVSVLDGETIVQLYHGKASLRNIHFKEGSYRMGGNHFILAARVRNITETTRIEEAFMDEYPFHVLTERSKANKKVVIPKLDDEVHGLKGIKRNGDYDNRLKNAGINTVQEFLKAFNGAPEKLRCQILNINSENNKPWREMVEHATKCDFRNDHRLKSWTCQVEKREVTLFFNVVHSLVGAEFSGCFVAKGEFTEEQKVVVDELLKVAYQELTDTFDHIMKDNGPVNIHASINAAGSRSVPISGIDCADGTLPGTAGQSAPEPSRYEYCNEIVNQGVDQDHTPKGYHDDDDGAISVSDVPVAEAVNGTHQLCIFDLEQQDENHTPIGGSEWEDYALLAKVIESDESNHLLDLGSGENFDLSTNPTFGQDQAYSYNGAAAAGNWTSAFGKDRASGAILGDTNHNAVRYRPSEPSPPDHEATFQAAAPGSAWQPSTAPGFASPWNQFEDSTGNFCSP